MRFQRKKANYKLRNRFFIPIRALDISMIAAWFSLEGNKSQMSISETHNPWSTANASSMELQQDTGWADFDSFSTEFPQQGGERGERKSPSKINDSGDKNSNTALTIDASAKCPEEKNRKEEEEKKGGSDTDEDEIFVCASDNIGAENEESTENTSQSCK